MRRTKLTKRTIRNMLTAIVVANLIGIFNTMFFIAGALNGSLTVTILSMSIYLAIAAILFGVLYALHPQLFRIDVDDEQKGD